MEQPTVNAAVNSIQIYRFRQQQAIIEHKSIQSHLATLDLRPFVPRAKPARHSTRCAPTTAHYPWHSSKTRHRPPLSTYAASSHPVPENWVLSKIPSEASPITTQLPRNMCADFLMEAASRVLLIRCSQTHRAAQNGIKLSWGRSQASVRGAPADL